MRVSVTAAVLIACLMFATGCGAKASTRKLIKVSGTVTFAGKPLETGTITFVAEGNEPMNAAGDIKAGKYTLSTEKPGDGAPPGAYKVRIESWATPPKMDEKGFEAGKSAIPERFNVAGSSGLTATIKDAPAAQEANFDLTE